MLIAIGFLDLYWAAFAFVLKGLWEIKDEKGGVIMITWGRSLPCS